MKILMAKDLIITSAADLKNHSRSFHDRQSV
jgi:hypothetical protein